MTEQQRVALIFAVDTYDHPELAQLAAPVADAQALAETLGSPELGGFSVEICHNESSTAIAEKLEDFLTDRKSGDLAILHFSGHGLKDESGSLYLAARNTIPTRLASTAIDATLVNLLMRRSRARSIVLFLDCCYGGAFERGMLARADGNVAIREQFSQAALGGGRGRVVITASSAVQYAFEGTTLTDQTPVAPSLFTGAVVDGIRSGDADRDADGFVSLGELYDFVHERVLEQSPHQTPSKWEYGMEGDLIISRSPRRRLRPVTLPDELVQIIRHPYPVARRGAIDELSRLASSSDLSIAAAAIAQLTHMGEDDSRSIALAAAQALDALRLNVSPAILEFGDLELDQPVAQLPIELDGPPVVELAEFMIEDGPFTAQLRGRTLVISISPEVVGHYQRELRIDSLVGSAVVPLICSVVQAMTDPTMTQPPEPRQPVQRPLEPAVRSLPSVDAPTPRPPEPTVLSHPSVNAPAAAAHSAAGALAGPIIALVGCGLVLVGLFSPWSLDVFAPNGVLQDAQNSRIVLLLPVITMIAAASTLLARHDQPSALGVLLGALLTSVTLWLVFVAVVAQYSDNPEWQWGAYVELAGLIMVLAGLLRSLIVARLFKGPIRVRFDRPSQLGAALFLAGLIIAIAQIAIHSADLRAWMLVFPCLFLVITLPVPFLALDHAQRNFVCSAIVVLLALQYADAISNIAVGAFSDVAQSYWWLMMLGGLFVAAGCIVGQLPRATRHDADPGGPADG